jgi:hypothetical protein
MLSCIVLYCIDRYGVHAVQKSRCTALGWASERGHVECVRLLLDRGVGVDVVDVSSCGREELAGSSHELCSVGFVMCAVSACGCLWAAYDGRGCCLFVCGR